MSNKKIDVVNNTVRPIYGKGGLILVPGRNIGVDAGLFAAAFYDKEGKPTKAAEKHFESGPGKLAELVPMDATNIDKMSAEDAARVIGDIYDRGLLTKLISSEKRDPVLAALKAQQEKVAKSLEKASEEDNQQGNQKPPKK